MSSSTVATSTGIPVPKIKDGILEETAQIWNTRNLGLRLGADATSAATASMLVAPVICVIDQYDSIEDQTCNDTDFL